MMDILMSFVGIFTLLAIGFLLSNNKKAINYRTIGGALAIQAGLGGFVLFVPLGKDILKNISDGVSAVINYGQAGIDFLFGGLGTDLMYENGVGFVFAVRVLPIIVFFSSLIAVLYYLGVMQWVIRIIGGGLQKMLGTSRTESMSATANIFVGQTEAPLVVKPYVPKMTDSELFAIMVGGLASIAGSTLGGYAQMGVPVEYLVAASFMAAPGGLLMAKLIYPETEKQQNAVDDIEDPDHSANILDAAAAGASSGLMLALNVGAMLLAFIGLIALVNGVIGSVGTMFGYGDVGLSLAYSNFQSLVSGHSEFEIVLGKTLETLAEANNIESINLVITDVSRGSVVDAFTPLLETPDLAIAAQAVIDAANVKISMEYILGLIFMPLAFLIGVPWDEAFLAGSFIGQKIIINEFIAYHSLLPYIVDAGEGLKMVAETGAVMTEKTQSIIAFSLCGFANLGSIAILLGGLGSMAPKRRSFIAKMGIKAIIAGSLANLMSGAIAGLFISL